MSSRSSGIYCSLLVAVLALPACGGKSFDTSGGESGEGGTTSGAGTSAGGRAQAGTSAGGSANGGSAHGGTSSGGATSGGTSSGGSGGSGQCDAFGNESGPTVLVQIANETKMPIHLGQLTAGCAGGMSLFSVADAAGKALVAPGFCATTCDDVIHGTIRACPAIACAINSAITLEPGESLSTQWNGTFMVDEVLPPACRPANGQSECKRIESVKPGAFTFSAQASSKIDCTQFGGGGTCSACMPNQDGGCTTFGAVIVAPLLTAETKVMLDGSYGVGGGGGDGQVNTVQIVFKN